MTDFKITFSHPWLLLLLIPALALTLFPFFRIAKKYRRNRNRVISVVLHTLVMTLCISLLAGITFLYRIPNKENEIVILVDGSYSNRTEQTLKDDFIQSVLDECGDNFKVGIVKFGYNQVRVSDISSDVSEVYEKYIDSAEPDISATDFTSALNYAADMFGNRQSGKILLISDGLETDGNALGVIKSLAASGIKVDVAHFPSEEHDEVQVVEAVLPDYNVKPGVEFGIGLTVKSNLESSEAVSIKVTDTDEAGTVVEREPVEFGLSENTQTLELKHAVSLPGMHQLRFELTTQNSGDDANNNVFYSYIYLNAFENILIIEKDKGESQQLKAFLDEQDYTVTVMSVEEDLAYIPSDLGELCEYEQVILVNIAYSDMPEGFDKLIYDYVNTQGGGLFTVGGNNDVGDDGKPKPHAYNRDDVLQSQYYKQLLPVQVVDYTSPVAVMIVLDHSGSMGSGEDSVLANAKRGVLDCVNELNSRDYCGIMQLDTVADEILPLTPVSQRQKILDAVGNISINGDNGTLFTDAIDQAGDSLSAASVEIRHILLVTDGQPADIRTFIEAVDRNTKKGITLSILGYGAFADDDARMKDVAENHGNGKYYKVTNVNQVPAYMAEDVRSEAVAEIEYGEEFVPRIRDHTSAVAGLETATFPALKGYYGTREKEGAEVALIGKYVPIYAQWKFGAGTVGSFMCDLNGTMSGDFLNEAVGQRFISNVISGLFPVNDIKPKDIVVNIREDNYTTNFNLFTELEETQKIDIAIVPLTDSAGNYYAASGVPYTVSEGYTRFTVIITQPGIYSVTFMKKDAAGAVLSSVTVYKCFSYSQEYNLFPEKQPVGEELLSRLATDGNGIVVEEVSDIFDSFLKYLDKVFDPRLLFLILAIVLFLLDLAVRKFKFKWPHEIIRDYRQRKEMNGKNSDEGDK